VPALKIGKRVIWDSLAIIEYLADVHGGLWPAERDARAMARAVSAEMHAGFQALRDQCPMEVLARTPNPPLTETAQNDIRRIVRSWREVRGGYGAGGPFLFGAFTAADAMYAPVVFRFRTYVPDLAPYGDDGTAKAYVEAMLDTPEMMAWEAGARAEVAGRSAINPR
jgi:glutathione S-transferase